MMLRILRELQDIGDHDDETVDVSVEGEPMTPNLRELRAVLVKGEAIFRKWQAENTEVEPQALEQKTTCTSTAQGGTANQSQPERAMISSAK